MGDVPLLPKYLNLGGGVVVVQGGREEVEINLRRQTRPRRGDKLGQVRSGQVVVAVIAAAGCR